MLRVHPASPLHIHIHPHSNLIPAFLLSHNHQQIQQTATQSNEYAAMNLNVSQAQADASSTAASTSTISSSRSSRRSELQLHHASRAASGAGVDRTLEGDVSQQFRDVYMIGVYAVVDVSRPSSTRKRRLELEYDHTNADTDLSHQLLTTLQPHQDADHQRYKLARMESNRPAPSSFSFAAGIDIDTDAAVASLHLNHAQLDHNADANTSLMNQTSFVVHPSSPPRMNAKRTGEPIDSVHEQLRPSKKSRAAAAAVEDQLPQLDETYYSQDDRNTSSSTSPPPHAINLLLRDLHVNRQLRRQQQLYQPDIQLQPQSALQAPAPAHSSLAFQSPAVPKRVQTFSSPFGFRFSSITPNAENQSAMADAPAANLHSVPTARGLDPNLVPTEPRRAISRSDSNSSNFLLPSLSSSKLTMSPLSRFYLLRSNSNANMTSPSPPTAQHSNPHAHVAWWDNNAPQVAAPSRPISASADVAAISMSNSSWASVDGNSSPNQGQFFDSNGRYETSPWNPTASIDAQSSTSHSLPVPRFQSNPHVPVLSSTPTRFEAAKSSRNSGAPTRMPSNAEMQTDE